MVGANLYVVNAEAVLELWTERPVYGLSRLQRIPPLQGHSIIVLVECRFILNLGG